MGPNGAGEDVVKFVNWNSDYLPNSRTDSVPEHGNYDKIGTLAQ